MTMLLTIILETHVSITWIKCIFHTKWRIVKTGIVVNGVEHLFMCLFVICTSSLVTCLMFFAHFPIWLFAFLLLNFETSFCFFLDTSPLLAMWIQLFSPFLQLVFSSSEGLCWAIKKCLIMSSISTALWIVLLVSNLITLHLAQEFESFFHFFPSMFYTLLLYI